MKNYFPLIDILRFFAALSVMLFHYFALTSINFVESNSFFKNMLGEYLQNGFMGVELFFIISGFVIYFSLDRSIKEYFLGRFLRLYPIFWVCATISYVFTILGHEALPFYKYLLNLFIISKDGKTANMIDGSYWTLTYEIFFYFYIGIYVYFFKLKNIEWFYYLWILFSLLTFYFGLENIFITKVLMARYAPYFVVGGLFALIYKYHNTFNIWQKFRSLGFLFISLLSPFYISEKLKHSSASVNNNFGVFNFDQNLILLFIYIIVLLAIVLNKKTQSNYLIKISLALGSITYPLYLLHHKIGEVIINSVSTFGYLNLFSVSVTIIMIYFAYFLAKYEEKHRKKLYKYFISKLS